MSKKKPSATPFARDMAQQAGRAADLLKAMAHPQRLRVLCLLAEGERSVGEINRDVELSQSALSQHLALLRSRGLVKFRREGQTLHYSLDGLEAPALLAALYQIYCRRAPAASRRRASVPA